MKKLFLLSIIFVSSVHAGQKREIKTSDLIKMAVFTGVCAGLSMTTPAAPAGDVPHPMQAINKCCFCLAGTITCCVLTGGCIEKLGDACADKSKAPARQKMD